MAVPPLILVAGTNSQNLDLLAKFLRQRGYACVTANGTGALDQAIDSEQKFDLAMLDVSGFDASIWMRCQALHEHGAQLLVISPRQSADLRQQSIRHGASDVLVKPLVMRELTELIARLL